MGPFLFLFCLLIRLVIHPLISASPGHSPSCLPTKSLSLLAEHWLSSAKSQPGKYYLYLRLAGVWYSRNESNSYVSYTEWVGYLMQTNDHFCCSLVVKSCLTLLWPHGLNPARLLCPWDSPGKNTGVGCHFLLWGIGIYCLQWPRDAKIKMFLSLGSLEPTLGIKRLFSRTIVSSAIQMQSCVMKKGYSENFLYCSPTRHMKQPPNTVRC